MALENKTRSINSQCQIVILPWKFNTVTENLSIAQLTSTLPLLDVSNELVSVSFTKNMSEPSGSFEFELPNNRDWSEFIKPGTWCLIYMSQDVDLAIPKQGNTVTVSQLKDQSSKLRCMGYIERAAPKGTIGQDLAEFDIAFSITGRDFGIIYEETRIWHNNIKFEANLQFAAVAFLSSEGIKTVDGLLDTLHRLFYSPGDFPGLASSLTNFSLAQSALQWLLPSVLIQALNLKVKNSTPFYGNIEGLLAFDKSDATFPVVDPISLLNGYAWDQLKSKSIEPFHELFTETDDEGKPHLIFRPIPWRLKGENPKLGTLAKSVGMFGELDRVVLSSLDVLDFDLAVDNHNRYNVFHTISNTTLIAAEDNMQFIGEEFPRLLQNSIHRHGFRAAFIEINATIIFGKESINQELLINYNELNFEYWNNAIFLESGSLEIIGNNGIKLGKVLELEKGVPYNATKLLYIEGYTDNYIVEESGAGFWTQSLILTRGIEKAVLKDLSKITKRQEAFTEEGEFTKGN